MSPYNAAAAAAPVLEEPEIVSRRLPSGQSLVLRLDGAGEDIEIRSARGELEVHITLTDAGPVVSLRGARLEVESPDVAFRCRTFDVQASGPVTLASEREVRVSADELRMETARDIHLNGAFIRLNCTEGEAADMVAAAAGIVEASAGRAAGDPQTPGLPDPHHHHHEP